MCGIVGIIGEENTLPKTVHALRKLEYRGYDSFGLSTIQNSKITYVKGVGSISEQDENGFFKQHPESNISIAHTRWATHGKVSIENCHPHQSYNDKFSLVHNGVIENYLELKKELAQQGVVFNSETDTEVIVHLLAKHYEKTKDLLESIVLTNSRLEGNYAYVFTTLFDTSVIYGTCSDSPLCVGNHDNLSIIASDQLAISIITNQMVFLLNGDIVRINANALEIYNTQELGRGPVIRERVEIMEVNTSNEKEDYSHYMLKELHEGPSAINAINNLSSDTIEAITCDMLDKQVAIVGAGSSNYVSQIGQYFFHSLANEYAISHPADEMIHVVQPKNKHHLIAISQSGETFDTLQVVKLFRQAGATVTAINNVSSSSCQRLANYTLFQGAGVEVSVLSTKSVISQTMALYRLALELGKIKNFLTEEQYIKFKEESLSLPKVLKQLFIQTEEAIKMLAVYHNGVENWFFIGRGILYPVAMENALKFKEVSYIHGEGVSAGSLKHGMLSLIDENFYTIAFLPNKKLNSLKYQYTLSNISEIQARGGKVIVFGSEFEESIDLNDIYSYIKLPSINEYLDSIIHLVAGQLFAYYTAESIGRNIDKPRSLAKAVTVR